MNRGRFFSAPAALALLACTSGAQAIDVAAAALPAPVVDQQLTIGPRTLTLPAGSWTVAARGEGTATNNDGRRVAHYTVYAVGAKDGKFAGGVQLRLLAAPFYITSWTDQPCRVEGALFKDEFDRSFSFPECMTVFKRATHLSPGNTDPFWGQASRWAASENLKTAPVYEVFYTRLSGSDLGFIRVYVPQAAVANDEAVIEWSKQLAPKLKRFFESRDTQFALPALPAR